VSATATACRDALHDDPDCESIGPTLCGEELPAADLEELAASCDMDGFR